MDETEGVMRMIQIDMPMPKNCLDCPACNEYLMCAIPCNGRGWGENDVKDFSQSRPEWCPMKEIVRCKDCKHFTYAEYWADMGHGVKILGTDHCPICKKWGDGDCKTDENGYCFLAERTES